MTITEIEITPEELKEAVGAWLKTKGIDLPIEKITDFGYPVRGYRIIPITEPIATAPSPIPTEPETT